MQNWSLTLREQYAMDRILVDAAIACLNEVGPGKSDLAFEVGAKHARIRFHASECFSYLTWKNPDYKGD